jgi:hypothetical protein
MSNARTRYEADVINAELQAENNLLRARLRELIRASDGHAGSIRERQAARAALANEQEQP